MKCLKKYKPPSSNISKGEFVAIQELKWNKDITILPADKGRATVTLNTTDYETKMATLLNDPTTYEPLAKDTTAIGVRDGGQGGNCPPNSGSLPT